MADCKLIDTVEAGMKLKNPEAQRRAEAIVSDDPTKIVDILRETGAEGGSAYGAGKFSTLTPQHGAELGNNLVLQWGERQAQKAITKGDALLNRHVIGHSVNGTRQVFGKASVSPESIQHNVKMLIKKGKVEDLGTAFKMLSEQNGKGWFDDVSKIPADLPEEAKKAMVGMHRMFKELGEAINEGRAKNGLAPIDLRDGYIPTSVMGRYVMRGHTLEGRPVFLTAERATDIEKQIAQLKKDGITVVKQGNVEMRKDTGTFDAMDRVLFPDVATRAKNNMIPSFDALTSMHVGGEIGAKYAVKNMDNNARRLANYVSSLEMESKIKELGSQMLDEETAVKDRFSNEIAALADRSRRIGGINFANLMNSLADNIDGALERYALNKLGVDSKLNRAFEGGLIKNTASLSTKTMTALKVAGNILPQIAGSVFQPVLFGPTHTMYLAEKYGMSAVDATKRLASAMGDMLVSDKGALEYMNKMIDAGELFHAPVEIAEGAANLKRGGPRKVVDTLYHLISRGEDFNRVVAGYASYKHLTERGFSHEDAFGSSIYDAAQYIPSSKRINKSPFAETVLGKQFAGSAMAMRGYMVHGWGTVLRTITQAKGDRGRQAGALLVGSMMANGLAGALPIILVDGIIKTLNSMGGEYPTLGEMIAADDGIGEWVNEFTGESQFADNYTDALKYGALGFFGHDVSRAAATPGPTLPVGLPPGLTWMAQLGKDFYTASEMEDPNAIMKVYKGMLPGWAAGPINAIQQETERTPETQARFGLPTGKSYDITDPMQMAGFDTTKNVTNAAKAKLSMLDKKSAKQRVEDYADTIARAIASGDTERAREMLRKYGEELSKGDMRGKLMAQEELASKVMQKIQRSKLTAEQADYSTTKGAIAREGRK